jgi:hypothetical protein
LSFGFIVDAWTTGATVGVATAACSRFKNAPSSWMVLISGAGKTTVVCLVDPDLDQALQVAQLKGQRVGLQRPGV